MKSLYSPLLKGAILFLLFPCFQSLNAQPEIDFVAPVAGFSNPVDIVAEPGSARLFIVEQGGLIRIVDGTDIADDPFLDVSDLLSLSDNERGLLSMAFHPDYLNPLNRYFFIYYTGTTGALTLARYQREELDADLADESSAEILLSIPHAAGNHNGGKLNFGSDGYLYFGTGDGGGSNDGSNNAQTLGSRLGKMLRLDVDNFTTPPFYEAPASNPFFGVSPDQNLVFALGLRNPWRWSFDRENGDIWIADVGQGNWEEVNHVTAAAAAAGLNYGWRCREGNHANPNITPCTPAGGTDQDPIFEYTHNGATGGFSITGGYVYRGTNFPSLDNYYVTADYISGNLWLVRPDGSFLFQDNLPGNISGFGEGNDGELYAISRSAGTLYSIIDVNAVLPVSLVRFTGSYFAGYNELKWTTVYEENTKKFIVEYSTNGRNYLPAGEVLSTLSSSGDSYSFKHHTNNTGLLFYRLRIMDIDQSARYSPVISISSRGEAGIKLYPSVIANGVLQVNSGPSIEKIDLFSFDGRHVYSKLMNGVSGYFTIPLPALQKGMYLVRLTGKAFQQTEKIVIQ